MTLITMTGHQSAVSDACYTIRNTAVSAPQGIPYTALVACVVSNEDEMAMQEAKRIMPTYPELKELAKRFRPPPEWYDEP